MFRTRAAGWRTAGIAAATLATGMAFLGLTGPAKADTTLRDVYCYKNPPGGDNPDRIYISHVTSTEQDTGGFYTLNWRTETQVWMDLGNTYVNPTFQWTPWSIDGMNASVFSAIQGDPGVACTYLSSGGRVSDYVNGEWG